MKSREKLQKQSQEPHEWKSNFQRMITSSNSVLRKKVLNSSKKHFFHIQLITRKRNHRNNCCLYDKFLLFHIIRGESFFALFERFVVLINSSQLGLCVRDGSQELYSVHVLVAVPFSYSRLFDEVDEDEPVKFGSMLSLIFFFV